MGTRLPAGRWRLWVAAAWVVFAAAAYFLQLRQTIPPGAELYYGGLQYSARLALDFASRRVLPGAGALLLGLVAGLLGRRALLLMRLEFRDATKHVLSATALGLAILGLGASALAWLQMLRQPVVVAVMAAVLVVEWRGVVGAGRLLLSWRLPSARLRGESAARALVGIALAWNVALAALPPTFIDAVAHHFYIAKQFLAHGGLFRIWWVPYSDSMVFHDVLYAFAMAAAGPVAAHLLSALAGVWVGGYAYHIARTRLAPERPMLAAAIAYVAPMTFYLSTNGFTDLILTAFVLAAVDSILCWQEEHRPGWVVAAGVLLGAGISIKVSAAIALALLVAVLAATRSAPLSRRLKHAAAMAGVALLIVGPWLARSYAYTGNPVCPVLYSMFPENETTAYARYASEYAVDAFGSEHDLGGYVALPWWIFMRQSWRSSAGGYGGALVTPVFLIALPLLFCFPPRRRDERVVLAISMGFFVVWAAVLPHSLRYLAVVFPLWAALSVAVVSRLTAASRSGGRIFVALCLGLLLVPDLWTTLWLRPGDLQYVLVPSQERAVVERLVPALPILEAINETLPPDAPVFSFNLDRYYCEARLFEGWTDRTGRRALSAESAGEAAEALRAVGVKGILFSDSDQASGRFLLFEPEALGLYFQHVASANGWHFYTWASKKSKNGANE